MSATAVETVSRVERLPAHFATYAGGGRHDIATSLQYVTLGADGTTLPSTFGKTDFEEDREQLVPVLVKDLRGDEDKYSLDANGFQLVKHRSSLTKDKFAQESNIKDIYYPEVEDIVRRVVKASQTKVIHHVSRNSTSPDPNDLGLTRPLYKVHVDSTPDRVKDTIRMVFPDTADELLKKRYGLINVWRPLKKCFKDPFAYCDGSKVNSHEFVPRELVMPHGAARKENTAVLRLPESTHNWYYLYGHDVDEIVLIRCWDSKDGIVKRCPHSAVRDASMDSLEDRESVEVRCLVFWDD